MVLAHSNSRTSIHYNGFFNLESPIGLLCISVLCRKRSALGKPTHEHHAKIQLIYTDTLKYTPVVRQELITGEQLDAGPWVMKGKKWFSKE